MNIHTAAAYLKIGYRIRLPSWEPEEFLEECGSFLIKKEVYYGKDYNKKTKKFEERRYINQPSCPHPLVIEDLLSEEWEIITTGVSDRITKSGNLKYNDNKG